MEFKKHISPESTIMVIDVIDGRERERERLFELILLLLYRNTVLIIFQYTFRLPVQISSYNLQIRATDSGVPELVNFAFVQVQVTDVNDNPPLFSQHNYSAFVHVRIYTNRCARPLIRHFSRTLSVMTRIFFDFFPSPSGGQTTRLDRLPTVCDRRGLETERRTVHVRHTQQRRQRVPNRF